MTTPITAPATNDKNADARASVALRAQSVDTEVRTFDLVLGESADERPEDVAIDDVAEEESTADEPDDAEDQRREDGAERRAAEDDEAFGGEDARLAGVGVRGTRAEKVSAEGVRESLAHAATIDLAQLNAQKLTSPAAPGAEPARRFNRASAATASNGQGGPASPSTPAATVSGGSNAGESQANTTKGAAELESKPAPRANAQAGEPGAVASSGSANASAATKASSVAASGVGVVGGVTGATRAGVASASIGRAVAGVEGARAAGPEKPGAAGRTLKSNTPAPARPDTHPAIARVRGGLASILQSGGGRVTLALEPRELGRVRIDLTVKHGNASAVIQASNESARGLLEQNLSTLRESLEARGVRVDRLSVEVRSTDSHPLEAGRGQRHGTDAERSQTPGDGTPKDEPRSETGDQADAHLRGDARGQGRAPGGPAMSAAPAEREDPGGADRTLEHDAVGAGTPRVIAGTLGVDMFV